jgi:uncharacterized protein YjbI with pentapeptide repeats
VKLSLRFDRPQMSVLDFEEAVRNGQTRFSNVELEGVAWESDSFMNELEFSGCTFIDLVADKVILKGVRFEYCHFENSRFVGAVWLRTAFENCTLENVDLSSSRIPGTPPLNRWRDADPDEMAPKLPSNPLFAMEDCQLYAVDFTNASLSGAVLLDVDFNGCVLDHSELVSVAFAGSEFHDASFANAIVRLADFRGARMTGVTSFRGSEVAEALIDRHSLESMTNYGGLSVGQRMEMIIEDGALTLRRAYSGLMQWLHYAALTIFLAPYGIFLGLQALEASPVCEGGDCQSIGRSLLRYVWTGGTMRDFQVITFIMLIWAVFYNAVRAAMLWKTKDIELREKASGLPQAFSLYSYQTRGRYSRLFREAARDPKAAPHLARLIQGRRRRWPWQWSWATWFRIAQGGFWINLAVVGGHTLYYLMTNYVRRP